MRTLQRSVEEFLAAASPAFFAPLAPSAPCAAPAASYDPFAAVGGPFFRALAEGEGELRVCKAIRFLFHQLDLHPLNGCEVSWKVSLMTLLLLLLLF